MTNRQWPATKIGTAWLTYDPDDGWSEHDNPSDAEREFGAIVDHLRDESSDGWHESADTAAWGIWIPIERLRLVATAWPDDDTEEGERCRDAGWDALLDGNAESVELDAAAIDFCGRRAADVIKALREERDTARAEADALRASLTEARAVITRIATACATIDCEDLVAEHTTPDDYNDLVEHVERVVEDGHVQRSAAAKARPLATLLHRIPATEAPFVLTYHPDADPMRDGSGWLCEVDDWSPRSGPLDAVIAAACERLGVGHG